MLAGNVSTSYKILTHSSVRTVFYFCRETIKKEEAPLPSCGEKTPNFRILKMNNELNSLWEYVNEGSLPVCP